jgi:hypothetical protein
MLTRLRDGRPGFDSRHWQSYLLFATASRPSLWSAQPPIRRAPGDLSPGVRRPGHEVDHSPQWSVEVTNVWSYAPIPMRLYGFVLHHEHGELHFAEERGRLHVACLYPVWKFKILSTRERIQKFPDWVDNEINNNNKHSFRNNTKGYGSEIH